jgi:hypothetical protein
LNFDKFHRQAAVTSCSCTTAVLVSLEKGERREEKGEKGSGRHLAKLLALLGIGTQAGAYLALLGISTSLGLVVASQIQKDGMGNTSFETMELPISWEAVVMAPADSQSVGRSVSQSGG